jgi:hypothetical protein
MSLFEAISFVEERSKRREQRVRNTRGLPVVGIYDMPSITSLASEITSGYGGREQGGGFWGLSEDWNFTLLLVQLILRRFPSLKPTLSKLASGRPQVITRVSPLQI